MKKSVKHLKKSPLRKRKAMSASPSRILTFSEDFDAQMDNIIAFYVAEATPSVADTFISAVEKAKQRIVEYPEIGAVYEAPEKFLALSNMHFRKLTLTRFSSFPYTLYYRLEKKTIFLHAIYHESRQHVPLLPSASKPAK